MKLCTCLNCGNIYDDMNPQTGATEYPFDPGIKPLLLIQEPYDEKVKDIEFYYGCPVCMTDEHLMDEADTSITGIIARKILGIDCTEMQSAEIKRWLLETIIQPGTDDVKTLELIQFHFPIEYGEYLDEQR